MRKVIAALVAVTFMASLVAGAAARDRPFGAADLIAMKLQPSTFEKDVAQPGNTGSGGQFSKEQIERFRCTSPPGNPVVGMDISCNDEEYGQDWAPDNELAVAVDPLNANHVLAGSNDYFYRFNNSTGARQAIIPTGFFTSVDGGQNWVDGQIPMRKGNGAGDPAPAFNRKFPGPNGSLALMAQLENTGGQGGFFVTQGDISVSRSPDGGFNWSEPITVMKGQGAGIGPANNAVFWDKEFIAVNNYVGTPGYGRTVVTATQFVNGVQGTYVSSSIWLSYSDDGGLTWSPPMEIAGKNPAFCTFQSTGPDDGSCDEDQFSYPEFGPDGTLYVHFLNYQHEAAWEQDMDFDSQIMVVKAPPTNGQPTFGPPVHVVDLEDGFSDTPYSVIGSQTVWGHQLRWTSAGNISVNPATGEVVVIWADRATANPNATEGCFMTEDGGLDTGDAPTYDPCNAGPGSETNVYRARSADGVTWTTREVVDATPGHQWFPWADHKPNGTLVAAWDEDTAAVGTTPYPPPPPNDEFRHILWDGTGRQVLGTQTEKLDISVTHWAGQYVPEAQWPRVCGPVAYTDPPVTNATGKDCNVFHGDYTGLATGPDGSIHVVWTGLNRFETSPQIDFYTGEPHDGYAQDAMYARR